MFAKVCSCISRLTRPFVVNKGFVLILSQSPQAQKRTDVLLKMMNNEVEKYYIGTINSSFLSLALTKPKEKLLCEENGHLLLWFTGSCPGRTGSGTTIQPGLVLYQVANCFHLPVGQKSRPELMTSASIKLLNP